MPDKGGFPHYMLKEIFEQPKALEQTIAPRVSRETGQVKLADEVRIGAAIIMRHAVLADRVFREHAARLRTDEFVDLGDDIAPPRRLQRRVINGFDEIGHCVSLMHEMPLRVQIAI